MISTKSQLLNADVGCAKKFGERILFLYSKYSQSDTVYAKSLFETSFKNTVTFNAYQKLVRALAEQYIENDSDDRLIILPPILLRSESNFVLRYGKMIIIFESNGPIIPVVKASFLKECQEFITHMYRIHSETFIGSCDQFMVSFNSTNE